MLVTNAVQLGQLQDELTAAGVTVNNLVKTGNEIMQRVPDGSLADLPPEAQAIVLVHKPMAHEIQEAWSDLKKNYSADIARLDQLIVGSFANNTARDQAIKDIAVIVKRGLRAMKP